MKKEKYRVFFTIPSLDGVTVRDAERTFAGYRDTGVIRNRSFQDDVWSVTDEYANYHLNFTINATDFKSFGDFMHIELTECISFLKAYIIFLMGSLALGSLQAITHQVKLIVESPADQVEKTICSLRSDLFPHVRNFFDLLPTDGSEKASVQLSDFFDIASDYIASTGGRRTLAAFESYFRFNDILKRFWEESSDESEKIFYFPVWLWWHLTAVLPLRPREFLLIPRNCLSKVGGEYRITVRRTCIKGSSKTKSYKISDDYKTYQYVIPEALANEISRYQDLTSVYCDTDIHTLFMADTHYEKWGRCRPYTSRFFTYANLRTALRYFYEQVIQDRYGYTIIFERKKSVLSDEKEIEYLQLGDTRHLAMINMLYEGATPMVAMILAGHDNPDMSSHYYANISRLIECRTYRLYKKKLNGYSPYKISGPVTPLVSKPFILLPDRSRCFSENFMKGTFEDCLKAFGPFGEIGACDTCCYHREDGKPFHDSSDLYTHEIEAECKELEQIIRKVRKGKGYPEDILQVLLRLKNDGYSYQQYLLETMKES